MKHYFYFNVFILQNKNLLLHTLTLIMKEEKENILPKFFNKKYIYPLLIIFIFFAFNPQVFSKSYEDIALYYQAWKLVNTKFVDQTNNNQDWNKWEHKYDNVIQSPEDAYVAIDTMVASLNDPYTRFLKPKDFEEEANSIKGSLKGIGVQITERDGKIVVLSPLEDTPAERAGLLPNDEILSIDGVSTKGMNITKASEKIRGKKGTKVNLLIKRANTPNRIYTIERDEITLKSVSTKTPFDTTKLDDYIGYIRLSSFISRNAATEFRTALEKYSDKKGIIIDLRSNSGGLLTNAILIADMFLNGEIIVSTVDRDGYKDTCRSSKKYITDKPLVVLINKGSASASEILSGALKDNQRALLVGENTFGKGVVQEVNKMNGGSGMNITIQKYLTPNGTDIDKKGIAPDVEVKLSIEDAKKKNDTQLIKAQELLKRMITAQS